ncbi:MAG TPA: sugar ABC transporter ATP-binding protein [Solirubrobacteraceae bacterium]|nr:sugar ABC transporter ATP-binding protein [Solirubrobacteraceae bacterium]
MIEAQDISKSYGGVVALSGASLTVRAGSVHALLGENGAGKSTLVKIIAGAVRPDDGVLRLDGREVSFSSTAEAARSGVAVVSQELSLFPDLDVLSNLFPMREIKRGPFVNRAAMAERARPVLRELNLKADLRQPVGTLSLAQRQLLEIAKALVTNPHVLILDEPTSALEAASTDTLIGILEVLRDRQVAVLFVTHILEEVMAVCDEVTVLRDGRPVLEAAKREQLTVPAIVDAMLGDRARRQQALVGRGAPVVRPLTTASGDGGLSVEKVGVEHRLAEVSFHAASGEIVGLAGLAGSGHHTVIELTSGQRRPTSGRVLLPDGRPVPRGLHNAIAAGVALVTGDRRRFGLMLDKPVWENIAQVRGIALAHDGPIIRRSRLRQRAHDQVERLRVRTGSLDTRTGQLSGGNQQKVVFAKWLNAEPSVMVLDDPTRGVDVGAKAEMHALIRSAANAGAVVLLASTDLDELEHVCDRVLVFYRGRVAAELSGEELRVHTVLEAMNTGRLSRAA